MTTEPPPVPGSEINGDDRAVPEERRLDPLVEWLTPAESAALRERARIAGAYFAGVFRVLRPVTSPDRPAIDANIAAYERMRSELEERHKGKFALIDNGRLEGCFETSDAVARHALQHLGTSPYLIIEAGGSAGGRGCVQPATTGER